MVLSKIEHQTCFWGEKSITKINNFTEKILLKTFHQIFTFEVYGN